MNTGALLPAKLQQAVTLHRQGDLAHARCLYEEILDAHPQHFDALHLLGVVAIQTRNPHLALTLIDRAIDTCPTSAAAHCNKGSALEALDQVEDALSSFTRALSIKPDYVEAHFNRANLLFKLKRYELALSGYDRTIALDPNLAQAYFNRGNALRQLRRWQDAANSYESAIRQKPDYADAYCNRGLARKEMHLVAGALADFDKAISLEPNNAVAHSNRGNLLKLCRQWNDAIASYDRAIAADIQFAEPHFNRGVVLHELGRFEEALASYGRAIAIRHDYAEAYSNRGNALTELNRLDDARVSYNHAIAMRPDYAPAWFNRSVASLLAGDYAEGWRDYEWRWKNEAGSVINELRVFSQPLWLGEESPVGKTILVYSEQGFGDSIHFCRYVKLLADAGARVILEVKAPLQRVLAGLEGVFQLVAKGSALPHFDCQCPLLSLPLAFGTRLDNIPSAAGYLHANSDRIEYWQSRLGERVRPRIGLVWSGNANQKNDHKRSVPLAALLSRLPSDFQYVCLQTDVREPDRRTLLANPSVIDFGPELDFENTAALCKCLDLVISVDTSVAHLSAALGQTTWIMLPFNPDWRWLLERDDSPWYSSVTLLRQASIGDWSGVLSQIGEKARELFHADNRG